MTLCSVDACERISVAHGMCSTHRKQFREHGRTWTRELDPVKRVAVSGDIATIRICNSFGDTVGDAKVSVEDVARVSKYIWSKMKNGYAVARIDGRFVLLHRFVLSPNEDDEIDHINGDRLDNRRENLRIVDRKLQAQNVVRPGREALRGVYYIRGDNGLIWFASVTVDGVSHRKSCSSRAEAINEARRLREQHMTNNVEERHEAVEAALALSDEDFLEQNKHHCRGCGGQGHNRRTCPQKAIT